MLPYGRQTIDDSDVAAVVEVLRAPYLTCGPLVGRFEKALASWLGVEHVSTCSSGTAALHLAYAALGIREGDEVITSPITFSATAAAAYYVGATVRFADVDPKTGNLCPRSVERLVTRHTRAIVPVHLAGQPANLDEIWRIAAARNLRVIEDACHALGAVYRGQKVGAHGHSDAIVFSFHPVKHITTGEGGAVIVRDARIKARIDRLRQHGIERDPENMFAEPEGPWTYEVQELGWNYRLSDLGSALGLAQLARLDAFLAARRLLAVHYRAELARTFEAGVKPPAELGDRASAYHLMSVAIDFPRFGTTRAHVVKALAAAGIATQVHYPPLLSHPLHASRCPGELAMARPGVDQYYAQTLSLPLYPSLSTDDVRRVVAELRHVLGEFR